MSALTTAKGHSPRVLLDVANTSTRAFGMATARWRALPDFFIVGTKRGGTTSLWNWLDSHPQVLSMFPRTRGLKSTGYFFRRPQLPERWYRSHFHTTAYRALQSRAHGRVLNGEASPYYMYAPHIPRLIAELAPDARLVVLLRDPVERAYSHFHESTQQGRESLEFSAALAAEEERIAEDRDRAVGDPDHYAERLDHFGYRDRGVYLPQLQRLHAAFPRDQVLVLRSEDLYASPQATFDATCRFLGLAHHDLGHPRQYNEIRRAPMPATVREELVAFYRPHNAALADYLGRELWWD